MAEEHRNKGPPRNDLHHESQYPPLPGEEDDRSRGIPYHPRPQMAAGVVTLPSIQDPTGPYGQPPTRAWDSRNSNYGASPSSSNGYPPPPGGQQQQQQQQQQNGYSPPSSSSSYPPPPNHQYLPPVQPHPEARPNYPPQDPRAQQYYAPQRSMPPYNQDNYAYAYRPERGPPGYGDYPQGGPGPAGMQHQQAAPRQRTSIACRYCRRRKIRCSGYQNSPGGKCTNCIKMNQDCVFQPVSSNASTAFVPVSALQNIPPGTQLYGSYGQPLPGAAGPYQGAPPQYDQPLPSPTGSFGGYPDDRSDPGRRRQRPTEDDHAMRLPPPSTFPEDGIRRRSPSSSSSPNHLAPYQPLPTQPAQPAGYDNRTPPPRGSPSRPAAAGTSSNPKMSLGSIMDTNHDIDRGMLGRLNRQTK